MTNEQLSVWVDGEAGPEEAVRTLEAVTQHASQRKTCEMYWLIGDTLRAQTGACSGLAERVMAELAQEPTVLAPRPTRLQGVSQSSARWMPVAAAVAGVAVAAWMGLSLWAPPSQSAAQSMAEAPRATAPRQVALQDEQAYFMAHQGSAMGAPMGGVAQYIRTVSDDRTGTR